MILENGFSFGGPLDQIIPKESPILNELTRHHSPQLGSDAYWMLEALKESLKSIGISNPNPAVGCVLVDSQGNEISRGATQTYRGLHAERFAFDQVQDPKRLNDATAYVTLEPCSYHGHQPPCVDLLVSSPIKRVVIAQLDPNPNVNGEGIRKLREAGKEVQIGLYGREVAAWNFSFFAHQEFKRPIIFLKWAQTLDGQLADDSDTSQWITGPTARAYTHWLRQRYDAILVGGRTVLADFPRLSVRDCALPHQSQPVPIIFDPNGLCFVCDSKTQTRLQNTTFDEKRPVAYITTETSIQKNPTHWLSQLKNVRVYVLAGKDLLSELRALIEGREISSFLERPLQSILIEGGAKTLSLFLKANYADCIHAFISPQLTAGSRNRIELFRTLKESQKFEILSTSKLGPDLLVEMVSSEAKQKVFKSPHS